MALSLVHTAAPLLAAPALALSLAAPAGSVLTQLDGTPLTDYSDLTTALAELSPGDTASIGWIDSTGAHTATVTLGRAPLA